MVVGHGRRRILVADDHPSVRENLRYLINAEPDLECIGAAKDGVQALRLCRELLPDVLVVDQDMPGIDGLGIAKILDHELPRIRIVVYTLEASTCEVAIAFGAAACVPKDAPYAALLDAVRARDRQVVATV